MEDRKNQTLETQIDTLIQVISLTLDDAADGLALASHACMSRFHFQRVFRKAVGETPGALRRRLLLERAAYVLETTRMDVTEIAFDSGYDSLQGFSRAFRRAYHVSPSHYRRIGLLRFRLPCVNGIHYDPRIRGAKRLVKKGTGTMDLTDRLLDHDVWMTRRLLERATELTDAQLDAPMAVPQQPLPFEAPETTVRLILERLIFTKEVWVHAVRGTSIPETQDTSIPGMQKRFDIAFAEFVDMATEVRDADRWDENFVDALCVPAETFTFGGMIAHVLTFSAYRRLTALKALESLGVSDLGYGDPIEWERSLAPAPKS